MSQHQNFVTLGAVAPAVLTNGRVELHWLAQVIGAVGDAFLERASDDGQSNSAWDFGVSALAGRPIGDGVRIAVAMAEAELWVLDANNSVAKRQSARGQTLAQLLEWAGETIGQVSGLSPRFRVRVRDYEMPAHPVTEGAAFSFADGEALMELSKWFANATIALEEAATLDSRTGEVRCWPHHFDIGGIFMLEPDKPSAQARQMGFGWSPGDGSYDEPYYYVTPFPAPDGLPALTGGGHWHREEFTGAILTGTAATKPGEGGPQRELAHSFLNSTIKNTLPLIEP